MSGLTDPETLRLTATRAVFSEDAVARHLAEIGTRADRADWAVIDADTSQYVGEVVLNDIDAENRSASFRIALLSDWTGRGYGTEATGRVLDFAFDDAEIHRVELEVFAFNPRAQRSYEKSGFRIEGRRRDALLWEGEWIDCTIMSVLRTDRRTGES